MALITLCDRGQITIPEEICKNLALKPGAVLEAYMEDGRIILEAKDGLSRSKGIPSVPLHQRQSGVSMLGPLKIKNIHLVLAITDHPK